MIDDMGREEVGVIAYMPSIMSFASSWSKSREIHVWRAHLMALRAANASLSRGIENVNGLLQIFYEALVGFFFISKKSAAVVKIQSLSAT